jgi:hypothetical protein
LAVRESGGYILNDDAWKFGRHLQWSLLVHRSINEYVPVATQQHVVWWSAFNSNTVFDLDAPSPTPAPATTMKTEDAEESSDFDFGSSSEGDGDDGADTLDFSAFDHRHQIRI